MKDSLPAVILTPRQRHRVFEGHLWIYRSEIGAVQGEPEDGAGVDVFDCRRRFVARGHFNRRSQITVRVLSRVPAPLDDAFWRQRLAQAIAYRQTRCPDRIARRLVHSEADLLPGLIVDQYGDHLVIQTTTLGMDRLKPLWLELLSRLLTPKAIWEQNDLPVRKLEGLPPQKGLVQGQSDGKLSLRIGQAEFAVDLRSLHKTGIYLDQQDNYERIARFVKPGMRVLDAFCHLAGFALHVLKAGAAEALAVDSNATSLTLARESAGLSGVADRLRTECGNAFDILRRLQAAKAQFDLIILDPPSFTRSRQTVAEASRGYKEIHLRALKCLRPGGILATFCCSHHVSASLFLDVIRDAAADTGALLRQELVVGAAPDHPVLPTVPETEYLKGFGFTLLEQNPVFRRERCRA